ncbi:MAG TPA: toxin-antitoxin system YwqK family antitoxin [Saprospiraceae bacterium]|nr:toxin-antitoxin system YwqK family antitoxin [Saprospiraceae bacterium]
MSTIFKSIFIIFCLNFFSCKSDVVETFYTDGTLKESYHVLNDSIKNGEYKSYNEGGSIFEISNYQNGSLEGLRQIYLPSGTLDIEEQYRNGVIHGEYKRYYESGQIKILAHYVDGVLSGEFFKYFPNGVIQEKVTMANNEENGPFEEFYPNGKLKWKGQYLNGDNEYGLLENYDSTGVLIKKMMCDSLRICKTIWQLDSLNTEVHKN